MATTTNYGWTTPDDTALVKDGASAIRTLGSSVDTSLKTVSDGRGLVHINTTTFSAVSSQAINSIFSATYDIYKILIYFTTAPSADCDVFLKLRASGTDSSATYTYGIVQITVGGAVSSFNGTGLTTGFLINRLDSGFSGYGSSTELTLQNPFAAQHTSGQIVNAERNSAGTFGGSAGGLAHITATSYDGIDIIASAGNISGVCTIFGFKK